LPPPKAKEHLTLIAGKCVSGGDCLALHEGVTGFIEGAVPGEKVEVLVTQSKKDLFRARVVRVLEPSPERVEPVCAHVKLCGGCQYQHMNYAEELKWKEAQVREAMRSFGDVVKPILRGPKEYNYRRSAAFHAVGGGRGKKPHFSYIGKDNVSAVLLKQCDILDPALEKMVLQPPMHAAGKIGYKMDRAGRLVDDRRESFFRVTLSGKDLIAHSQGFFQNNWEVTEKIAELVRGWLVDVQPEVFFDLYAGVGTFTFLCGEGIEKVVAVEESRHAVRALRMNKEEKKWDALEVVEGRVERRFREAWEKWGKPASAVLFDPPRQGMTKDLAETLGSTVGAKALIYVSCDPATMARDLKLILAAGRYQLGQVVPFDMFPRTKHVEAAALLLYKGK
jgi:23S rRNA (uracil1939-C5)-methyltransferase